MVSNQVQTKVREFLSEAFLEARASNARYSLRAFAKKVGVSPGALSEIIKGNRSISHKFLEKIEQKLELPPDFFELDEIESQKTPSSKTLTLEQFAVLSDPIHFSILALMDTLDFQSELDWMSHRLSRPKRDIQSAIERLVQLDLIEKRGTKFISTGENLDSPDEISSRAIKASHRQSLHEAEAALNEIEIEMRDFTTLTLAFETSKLKKAKSLIRRFRSQINQLSQTAKCDEVYKLSIQFYPVTNLKSKNEKKENN